VDDEILATRVAELSKEEIDEQTLRRKLLGEIGRRIKELKRLTNSSSGDLK